MERTPRTAGFKGKVFRPLLWWFILSVLLLLWREHEQQERRATVQFTVSIEGRDTQPMYRAALNDHPFFAGELSGLWRKRLTIHAADAEPFVTNVFVWYGGKNLGHITLARSRGILDLNIKPTALHVGVTNHETSRVLFNATRETVSLPTGRYTVQTRFARFSTEHEVEIAAQRTNRLVIDPGVVSLVLNSDPTNAEFELKSVTPPGAFVRSNAPVMLGDLPAGDYRLRIWRGDYEKTMPFRLSAGLATNELNVEFDYAKLTIASEPAGAEIRDGKRLLGTTPTNLTLPTGLYRLLVTKEGFRGTNLSLELFRNESRSINALLPNAAYADALDRAREYSSGTSPNYLRALDEVAKALSVKPGDESARALKRTLQCRFHLATAEELGRLGNFERALAEVDAALEWGSTDTDATALKVRLTKSKHDAELAAAEARRKRPHRYIEEATKGMRHGELFSTDTMQFSGSIDAARAALARALGRKPEFSILKNEKPDEDAAIFYAEWKSLATRQNLVLIAAQTAENEVTICFKLFQFTLDTALRLDGDNYRPLHPQHVSGFRAPFVEKQRASDLQAFKKRLEEELRPL